MARNLRERLRQLRAIPRPGAAPARSGFPVSPGAVSLDGWVPAGFQVLKRVLDTVVEAAFPPALPAALPVLIPDFRLNAANAACRALPQSLPALEELLFFDLETTGLSGGAGTVAFLAAFGRLFRDDSRGGCGLRVTQYLLLDYPGEPDFIQALSGELRDDPFVVSYNGKSFDSQILKTRCLMNGMRVPLYRHADLLHPARRLWKRVLSGCAQGTVEAEILGIDRRGDTPGALAPEIWFSFLKTGGTEALVGVCDHNRRDIAGLAAILAVMIAIAADPIRSLRDFTFDVEQLALRWRDFSHHSAPHRGTPHHELRDRGAELLRFAAEKGYPRAALVHALDLFRGGSYDEGRGRLLAVAESGVPVNIQAAALRSLAIDSERRLMDAPEALRLTRRALELLPEGTARRGEFERRAERLAQKTGLSR